MEITAAIQPPPPPIASRELANIEKKAEEFEALMLAQMLAPMFETVKSPGLFGGDGPEQDAFQSILHEHFAKSIAARGGIGIADSVKDALIRMQSTR